MADIVEAQCQVCGRSITDGRDICTTCKRAIGLLGSKDENLRNALAYVQARLEVRPVGRPRKVVHRHRLRDEENLVRNIRLFYVLSRYNAMEVATRFGVGLAHVKEMVAPVDAARVVFVDLF